MAFEPRATLPLPSFLAGPMPSAPALATERHQQMLDECVHCGLCLIACPTYRVLRLETESPRGRLHLMKAAATGEVALTEDFASHMGLCLQCRACETACPASVHFGHLMEVTRDEMRRRRPMPFAERVLRAAVFDGLLPHRGRLAAMGAALRLYQRSGLQRALGAGGLLGRLARRDDGLGRLAARLADGESLMPRLETGAFAPGADVLPGFGVRRHRVYFFLGCIQNVAFADVNAATVRVLRHAGADVVIPPAQTCCGALHGHAGERDRAKELARRNLAAFRAWGILDREDPLIVNAAGCGAALKEYGELLRDDPRLADDAARFSARVRDASEWLAERVGDLPLRDVGPVSVTYQDACHLAHAQSVRRQPRDVLRAIPGVTLVEMRDPDRCCGSAGIYNLLHPDIAAELRREKVENVARTGARVVASANPGCIMQLRAGLREIGSDVETVHVMTLLDRALEP